MSDQPIKADNRPISDRLRALGIEPGEHMEQWEKERVAIGEATNYVSRLYADAALAELMTALEEKDAEMHNEDYELMRRRFEKAEAERDALAVRLGAWADVGMDGMQKCLETVEAALTRSETAFGILSDLYPDEAQEAWRKAGELCGEEKP